MWKEGCSVNLKPQKRFRKKNAISLQLLNQTTKANELFPTKCRLESFTVAGWCGLHLSPQSLGCHQTEAGCSLPSTLWKSRVDKGVFYHVHCSSQHLIIVWPSPFQVSKRNSRRLILPVGYSNTFRPHTWENLLGLSDRCGCLKLKLGISQEKGTFLITSYSRTFWFQRGPLLCAGWSSTLEVWNSLFFPLGVCRDMCTSQEHCVLNQADEVVVFLVSCGVVSSGTEDPDEEYLKCNQSVWLKMKSITHTHARPIDRACQYPHKSPSRWILLQRLKTY